MSIALDYQLKALKIRETHLQGDPFTNCSLLQQYRQFVPRDGRIFQSTDISPEIA